VRTRKTHNRSYRVAAAILIVSTAKGGSSTQFGAISPETLAKQLFLKAPKESKA